MLLLAWTPVTHNSNRASVHVNVAQDLPAFHSFLHFKKIITSQKNPQNDTDSYAFRGFSELSCSRILLKESISLYSTPLSLSG